MGKSLSEIVSLERRHFNGAVAVLRLSKEITRTQLAKLLSVKLGKKFTAQSVGHIEQGKKILTNELFCTICQCLEIPVKKGVRIAKRIARSERIPEDILLKNLIQTCDDLLDGKSHAEAMKASAQRMRIRKITRKKRQD